MLLIIVGLIIIIIVANYENLSIGERISWTTITILSSFIVSCFMSSVPSYELKTSSTITEIPIAIQYEKGDTIGTLMIDMDGFYYKEEELKVPARINFKEYNEVEFVTHNKLTVIIEKQEWIGRPYRMLWNILACVPNTKTIITIPN